MTFNRWTMPKNNVALFNSSKGYANGDNAKCLSDNEGVSFTKAISDIGYLKPSIIKVGGYSIVSMATFYVPTGPFY